MDTITEFNIAPNRNSGGTQDDLTALHDLANSHPLIELTHVSNGFITLRGPAEILQALIGPFQPKLLAEENKALPQIDSGPFMGGFSPTISGGAVGGSAIEVIEDTPENETDEEEFTPLTPSTNGSSQLH